MHNSPQKEIKFACLYGRTSTSNQEDQKTIEAQVSEVKKFADEKGYIIVKEYLDEGWSGDILARPNLDRLRHDARNRIWDVVLAYDPDRLGRQLFYQQIVIDELKKLEIEVLFVTMPPIKNFSDELMFGIRGLFAQYEKAKITERFRIGKVNRVENDHVLTTEAPYGYTYVPNSGKRGSDGYSPGHYEVNEREKKILEDIFKMVADEGMTVRGVVRELHRLGIPPRKSKRGVWATSTLSTMLRHKAYIGKAHWGASYAVVPENPTKIGGYKKTEKTSRKMRPEKDWKLINVTPIIDKDLFDRAGLQLRKNFETLGRNKKNNFLLAGSIFCNCGGRRAGEGVQKGKHLYYRCINRVRTFPLPPTCKEASINAKIADEIVWENIKKIMSSPELLREQIEIWQRNRKGSVQHQSAIDIESTRREINKLQAQEDRYAHLYAKEVITLEKFEEYAASTREKIHMFEDQIAKTRLELEEMLKNNLCLPEQNEVEVFAQEASRHLKDLSFEAKQDIVRRASTKVISAREELQVHGFVSLNQFNVVFRPKYRNCRIAECGEVHAF